MKVTSPYHTALRHGAVAFAAAADTLASCCYCCNKVSLRSKAWFKLNFVPLSKMLLSTCNMLLHLEAVCVSAVYIRADALGGSRYDR